MQLFSRSRTETPMNENNFTEVKEEYFTHQLSQDPQLLLLHIYNPNIYT